MENVFVDLNEVAVTSSVQNISKPKRSAFVFITAELDSSGDALEELKKIEEVKEVYLAHGAYDIIAKISGDSFEHLREEVVKQIRNVSSIKSTLTLTVI